MGCFGWACAVLWGAMVEMEFSSVCACCLVVLSDSVVVVPVNAWLTGDSDVAVVDARVVVGHPLRSLILVHEVCGHKVVGIQTRCRLPAN